MLDKFNFDDITECAGLSDDMIKESYIKAIIESKEVKPGEETELERETEGNAEEDKLSESFNIGDNILGDLCFIEGKYVPFCLSQQYYVLVKKNNKLERAKLNLLIALGTEFGGGRFEQTRS